MDKLKLAFDNPDNKDKINQLKKKLNATYLFNITEGTDAKQEQWFMNFSSSSTDGDVLQKLESAPSTKPSIQITVKQSDFEQLLKGNLTGQKAFMQGKLKLKGNMMLATKLDQVFKMFPVQSNTSKL